MEDQATRRLHEIERRMTVLEQALASSVNEARPSR